MNTTYQVVIKGLASGQSTKDVAEKLAPLFKVSVDEASQMLNEANLVVKKGIDFQAAVKYVEALESCGCDCEVKPEAPHLAEDVVVIDEQTPPPALNKVTESVKPIQEVSTPIQEEPPEPKPEKRDILLASKTPKSKRFVTVLTVMVTAIAAVVGYKAMMPEANLQSPTTQTENTPTQDQYYTVKEIERDLTSISTVAGEVIIEITDTGDLALKLGNSIIAEMPGGFVAYIISSTDESILLMSSAGSQGTSCPGGDNVLVAISKNGKVTSTEEFGNCAELVKPTIVGKKIIVALPVVDQNMTGTETWTYEKGSLIKSVNSTSAFQVNEKQLLHVKADSETHYELNGEVITKSIPVDTSIISKQYLKLAKPVVIDNKIEVNGKAMGDYHDGSIVEGLNIWLGDPERFPAPKTGIKGMFDVTVQCSRAECTVSSIQLLDK